MCNNILLKALCLSASILTLPPILCTQDLDQDGINDQLEEALARKFAPEWRFHTTMDIPFPLSGSNQNIEETNDASSIEYLNGKATLFYYYYDTVPSFPFPVLYHLEYPIYDIDNIDQIVLPNGLSPSSPELGSNCNQLDTSNPRNRIKLFFERKLPGEPNSFPTYCRISKISSDAASISYFLLFPYDNKHELLDIGDHRSDWEGVCLRVSGINFNNAYIENAKIDTIIFSGHGSPRRYITGNSSKLRYVHQTHFKIYFSIGSHSPYPEPGYFFDYRISNWEDLYDDIFFGEGLVVQSWLPDRQIINVGEEGHPNPVTKWLDYKGWWGFDDSGENRSPLSPPCIRIWNFTTNERVSWEDFIGNRDNWDNSWTGRYFNNIFWNEDDSIKVLDCFTDVSTNYSPNPGYWSPGEKFAFVDCRRTCKNLTPDAPPGFSSLVEANDTLIDSTKTSMLIFPCFYPEPLVINKPRTLKAIEGPVIIGEQASKVKNSNFGYRTVHDEENAAIRNRSNANDFVFPNPTSDWLYWKDGEEKDAIVTSVEGQVALTVSKVTALNLSSLPQGMYFLRFKNRVNGKVTVVKVWKN